MSVRYKTIQEMSKSFSISIKLSKLIEFDSFVTSSDYDCERSRMISALISYFLINKDKQGFKKEILKLLDEI